MKNSRKIKKKLVKGGGGGREEGRSGGKHAVGKFSNFPKKILKLNKKESGGGDKHRHYHNIVYFVVIPERERERGGKWSGEGVGIDSLIIFLCRLIV